MIKSKKLIYFKKEALLLLSKLGWSKQPVHAKQQDRWNNYIDGAIGRPLYYLYSQAMAALPPDSSNGIALELGTGAGDVLVDLVEKGWNVTGVDKSPRSGQIVQERVKRLNGKCHFQKVDFHDFKSDDKYDLVLSFFSLPFLPSANLNSLFKKLSNSMKSGAVLAVNFFGTEHTWVKNGLAHPLTKNELIHLLDENNFTLDFFLNRIYEQVGLDNLSVHWDVLDVIAVKK